MSSIIQTHYGINPKCTFVERCIAMRNPIHDFCNIKQLKQNENKTIQDDFGLIPDDLAGLPKKAKGYTAGIKIIFATSK